VSKPAIIHPLAPPPARFYLLAAVAAILPGSQGLVEKLSIIPRSGGALGFTYIPPKTEDRWAGGLAWGVRFGRVSRVGWRAGLHAAAIWLEAGRACWESAGVPAVHA